MPEDCCAGEFPCETQQGAQRPSVSDQLFMHWFRIYLFHRTVKNTDVCVKNEKVEEMCIIDATIFSTYTGTSSDFKQGCVIQTHLNMDDVHPWKIFPTKQIREKEER